jgi:hypothetical protein
MSAQLQRREAMDNTWLHLGNSGFVNMALVRYVRFDTFHSPEFPNGVLRAHLTMASLDTPETVHPNVINDFPRSDMLLQGMYAKIVRDWLEARTPDSIFKQAEQRRAVRDARDRMVEAEFREDDDDPGLTE